MSKLTALSEVRLCPCGCGGCSGNSASGYRKGHTTKAIRASTYSGPEKAVESEGLLDFPSAIPSSRIAPILRDYLEAHPPPGDEKGYGLEHLAEQTSVSTRRLRSILHEEFLTVKFETVERILIGLGLEHLWHFPPEDGGLADWYEADELPSMPEPTPEQTATLERHKQQKNARAAA